MASSFAVYASQFLNNTRGTESGAEPLFYSFTTSEGGEEEYDLDTDDPHLGTGWLADQGLGVEVEEGSGERSGEGSEDGLVESRVESLTESLLVTNEGFNLPDPRRRVKRQDVGWTWMWGICVGVCYFIALVSPSGSNTRGLLPLLIPLIFLSAFASYLHILFLRLWVRPVMLLSALGTPLLLFICALCGLASSPLRLLSLLPLFLSIHLLHRLYTLYLSFPLLLTHITHTELTLALSTHLLTHHHPLLLLLSPLLLLAFLLLSIPFAVVVYTAPTTPSALFAAAVWVWSWGITRGVLRVTTAAVVGGWYFSVPWAPPVSDSPVWHPSSPSTLLLRAALTRASHSSLGSIILSALRETSLSTISLCIRLFLSLPILLFSFLSSILPTPTPFPFLPRFLLQIPLSPLTRYISHLIPHTSPFSQIYIALTGVPYRTASLRVSQTRFTGTGGGPERSRGQGGLVGGSGTFGGFPSLLSPLSPPLTLPLPFALITYYYFVSRSHTQSSQTPLATPRFGTLEPLLAALLAALTTALVGIFCVGVVRDVRDALGVCWVGDDGRGETESTERTARTATREERGRETLKTETQRSESTRTFKTTETGREESREGKTGRLRLGTGIDQHRRLVAPVFEYEAEEDEEVIHIHQIPIPRDGISSNPSIPRETIPPLLDSDDEDINPFHHSPNPSKPSPPASASSSRPPAVSAPVRSSSSSLSSLSSSGEEEEGGFFGSGLFG
ncbi:hypothetical protein C8R41DRAFT_843256 [Lentinula lateritia]|uniref:Protein PNS1 n=1 Tax=Lentinula lateritia TaxID=40482 RepID=A0ABQ8V7W2_9AGAR|nr:hypothetical protein C8R41DRAFT_843256 [Lentinula lateritia]